MITPKFCDRFSECEISLRTVWMPRSPPARPFLMHELRRVKRTQVSKHAKIVAAGFAVDCMVCDLTNLGAGLRVLAGDCVPERFDLFFDSALFSRHCQVRWRNKERLGVEFADAT